MFKSLLYSYLLVTIKYNSYKSAIIETFCPSLFIAFFAITFLIYGYQSRE